MRTELLDILRCPAGHEESGLVLSADHWQDVHVATGWLGCPVCDARYPIAGGVANFAGPAASATESAPHAVTGDRPVRLAAQLDLREPGGTILLGGTYAALARSLAAITDVAIVALDGNGLAAHGVSVLRVGARLPIADGRLRGAATDDAGQLTEFVRVLRQGSRIVAPVGNHIPDGVTEITRDLAEWVGSLGASASPVVPLMPRRTHRPR